MSGLKVFVSSTCYDLSVIRSQLRMFIQSLGHDPIMSDYSDILYDPRTHTHTSCVDEVATADVVVLIVGSRFGGKTVPEALAKVDFDLLTKESKSIESLKQKENLSVTQLEICKALESGIPVFTFIETSVWHDHALYERNKGSSILKEIIFPSIEKQETATFIFDFINFLRHRIRGNSVFSFSKVQEIEEILKKQWSSLFQKLLYEQRYLAKETKRIDKLTEQFEDLKTAILSSIGTTNEKDVAQGVVRFRRLLDFVRGLGLNDNTFLTKGKHSWDELMEKVGIESMIDSNGFDENLKNNLMNRPRLFLIKKDKTFFEFRGSLDNFENMRIEWGAFVDLPEKTREIIVDALGGMRSSMGLSGFLRYYREPFDYFLDVKTKSRILQERNELRADEDEIPTA